MVWNPSKVADVETDTNFQHIASQIQERQAAQQTGTARPSKPQAGWMFFDQKLGKPIWYNGTNWVDSSGTIV